MPELPEVETTMRGIKPHLLGRKITQVLVREPRLRWPVPHNLGQLATGQQIQSVDRRAKYLKIHLGNGAIMVHLGMSGSLRIVDPKVPVQKHDHVDLNLSSGLILRYRDPRKFGSFHWLDGNADSHPLLSSLGPEPLSSDFTGQYLFDTSRGRKVAIKNFLMNSHVVAGVGNIYANEALFMAGIRPTRAAGNVSLTRYRRLADCIKAVLQAAIEKGGTTLRDFVGGTGEAGYFAHALNVYGRSGYPCPVCGRRLREIRIGQRGSVFCSRCQT